MGHIPAEGHGVLSAGPSPRAAEGSQLGTSGWNALTAFGGRTLAVIRRGQPAVKWSFRSATAFSAAQSKEQIMRHQQGQAGENW